MKDFIPIAEPSITDREIANVVAAVRSGWVSSAGQYITEFETSFARYVGSKYAVAVANGTVALHLALESMGIGEGDEVIVPDLTFVATANAVTYTGAVPVFADIDPATWCLDPESLERKITSRTRAVIPVHLYGHPADMDAIHSVAKRAGIRVIEDAAEAHGAEYKGRKVGSLAEVGVFSFYGNKIITTGEGGMVVTDSEEIYRTARLLRDHGMSPEKRYWHTRIGYNYRMTNLQAALGVAQLERVEELLSMRSRMFGWYRELLAEAPEVRLNPAASWASPVCWMVCALLGEGEGERREEIQSRLHACGVDSRPFFYPISSLPIYGSRAQAPRAAEIAARGILLPSSVSLSREQVERVTTALLGTL